MCEGRVNIDPCRKYTELILHSLSIGYFDPIRAKSAFSTQFGPHWLLNAVDVCRENNTNVYTLNVCRSLVNASAINCSATAGACQRPVDSATGVCVCVCVCACACACVSVRVRVSAPKVPFFSALSLSLLFSRSLLSPTHALSPPH